MGYNKITNLLGKLDKDEIPKFTTIKWIEIFDQSNVTYNKNKDIRFKTNQLRNDLYDFNDAYIVVTDAYIGNVPGVTDPANGDDIEREIEDRKIVVPLKNMSNFMFNLDFLLIYSEIELILKWTEDCVLTEKATREELPAGDDPAAEPAVNAISRPKDLKFSVTDCKLYVPVVTLQTEYQNQLYKDLKTGLSIDFSWIKYRS